MTFSVFLYCGGISRCFGNAKKYCAIKSLRIAEAQTQTETLMEYLTGKTSPEETQ